MRCAFAFLRACTLGMAIEDLPLIWAAAAPDEFANAITCIPLRPLGG